MIYRDGYYYLLGTHGTCCDGVNSTYNIVVGRSKQPTGPFIDNVGRDMLKGGGKMVLAAGYRMTGAGHFGLYEVCEGVQKMSCHFEAHFGGWSMWEDACNEYKGIENFYVDCSSSLYAITPEAAKKVVRTYGAQHVLFATDYPMWDPSEEIERFMAIGLTDEENEIIFSKNVMKLFDIKL